MFWPTTNSTETRAENFYQKGQKTLTRRAGILILVAWETQLRCVTCICVSRKKHHKRRKSQPEKWPAFVGSAVEWLDIPCFELACTRRDARIPGIWRLIKFLKTATRLVQPHATRIPQHQHPVILREKIPPGTMIKWHGTSGYQNCVIFQNRKFELDGLTHFPNVDKVLLVNSNEGF